MIATACCWAASSSDLEPWDVAYYAEKQRAALYDFDEEALRPYLPLERVVAGMFETVQRLYGIRVTEECSVPVWHPEVKYYGIYDRDGLLLGGFELGPRALGCRILRGKTACRALRFR